MCVPQSTTIENVYTNDPDQLQYILTFWDLWEKKRLILILLKCLSAVSQMCLTSSVRN